MKRVTVFTPTYNRAKVLHRVYDSLETQSYRDFCWLIVDDGSVDDTRATVERFKAKANFQIEYVYQTNQGKHIATNNAVAMTDTELFIIADSDDGFTPNAIRRLVEGWDSIPEDEKKDYKGVICRCFDSLTKEPIGSFPERQFDSNDVDAYFKLGLNFEKWMLFRTDVLKEFPFPEENQGMQFFPETVIWQRMGCKYKTRYIDDPLREYFRDQEDALTRSKNHYRENVFLWEHYTNDMLGYFWHRPGLFLKAFVGLSRDNILLGKRPQEIMNIPNSGWGRFACAALYPVGWLLSKGCAGKCQQPKALQEEKPLAPHPGGMVSVIIPVYNGAGLIRQCLDSVLQQSYHNLQVIVVDDGSTDETYRICQTLAEEDSRICLIRQENSGVSGARNNGLSRAEGEFTLFVDADDMLPRDAVRHLVQACAAPADMAIGSYEQFRARMKQTFIRKAELISKDDIWTDSLRVEKLMRMAWGKLYRTQIIRESNILFDQALPFMEDTLFTWQYCKHINSIRVTDQVVYCYRLGGVASTVKFYPEKHRYLATALDVYADFFGSVDNIPKEFLRSKVTIGLVECINHYLTHCSRSEAAERIGAALEVFSPYLSNETVGEAEFPGKLKAAILARDGAAVESEMYKRFFFRIVAKKAKRQIKSWKIRV